jgi:hypothetical protein
MVYFRFLDEFLVIVVGGFDVVTLSHLERSQGATAALGLVINVDAIYLEGRELVCGN